MAFALVASIQQARANDDPTTSAIDTTGASLLVAAICHHSAGAGSMVDSKGNTWVELTAQVVTTSRARMFYVLNPTVGSGHTATFDGNPFGTLSFAAFSGANTTDVFDIENGATDDSASSLQPGSVTPNQNDSLIVTALAFNDTVAAPAINGGFSTPVTTEHNAGTADRGGSIAYLIQTTATAANPTWTTSVAVDAAAVIAVFIPAAGGGGVTASPGAGALVLTGQTLSLGFTINMPDEL